MKIKAIAANYKKDKHIVVYNGGDDASQYIGTALALYLADCLPKLTAYDCMTLFDIPQRAEEDYIIRDQGLPTLIDLSDTVADEREAHITAVSSLSIGGEDITPLVSDNDTVYIRQRYLFPLYDAHDVSYWLRHGANGPYIVAKQGMILVAAILPYDGVNSQKIKQYLLDVIPKISEGADYV